MLLIYATNSLIGAGDRHVKTQATSYNLGVLSSNYIRPVSTRERRCMEVVGPQILAGDLTVQPNI